MSAAGGAHRAASRRGERGPRAERGQFWRGFWNPHPLVLGAALLVMAGLLLGLQRTVTSGWFTVVHEASFVRTPHDDWGDVSWQVGRLKRAPPDKVGIYLMGGSNVRECIQTPASLEKAIAATCGVETAVYDFGSTNQHFGESLAIVDNLPPPPGVVVIGVNQTRFAYSPAEIRVQLKGKELLLRSPALWRFVRDHGDEGRFDFTIVPGIMSYAASWAEEYQSTIANGHVPHTDYVAHRYTQSDIWTDDMKQAHVDKWNSDKGAPGGAFDTYFDYDAVLLKYMVAQARERGYEVVLLEVPENQVIVGDQFDRFKEKYQPLCSRLADEHGAHYVDFNDRLDLPSSDFRDLTHLVEPGRVKWTQALAEALCPILSGMTAGETAP